MSISRDKEAYSIIESSLTGSGDSINKDISEVDGVCIITAFTDSFSRATPKCDIIAYKLIVAGFSLREISIKQNDSNVQMMFYVNVGSIKAL